MMSSKMNTTKYLLGVHQKRYDFNKLSDGDNTPFIPKGMIEKETQLYKERVAEKDKRVLEATRLASLQLQKEMSEKESAWWNRLSNMDMDEFKLMPPGFIMKYGSYIQNLERYQSEFKL